MARSRNIKPGFFANELLIELPFEHRLLFIGLWTIADRDGRLEDRPKQIKIKLFPGDNLDVEAGLAALAKSGFILRYNAGGTPAIQVQNWRKHQQPHFKEKASSIQAPDKPEAFTPTASKESPGQAPDKNEASPEPAALIPDSLQSDSLQQKARKRADDFKPPDWIPTAPWDAFLESRKRHPPTQRAKELLVRELEKLRDLGHDPAQVLEQSTRNGWRDVFPLRSGNAGSTAGRKLSLSEETELGIERFRQRQAANGG